MAIVRLFVCAQGVTRPAAGGQDGFYTARAVAASQTSTQRAAAPVGVIVWLPFALYAAALAAAIACVPYRPALDDPEVAHLARSFAATGRLAPGELFLRVPFWQMLLGGVFSLVGERAGVLLVQSAVVLASLATLAAWVRRERLSVPAALAVALLFAASPQIVLYARHLANELFVGWLAMAVVVLATGRARARAVWLGLAVGVAAMTKLAAALLVLPALAGLWRERAARRRNLALAGGALAAVVAPLVVLARVQRGSWVLDDTSAFNLGALDAPTWSALGAPARSDAALESFARALADAPLAYLAAALGRAAQWLLRPGSLDLRAWIPQYPPLALEVGDVVVFFSIVTLAVLGTRRDRALAWIFPVGIWLACSLPQKTPYSPRVAVLFPLLLLAPAGWTELRSLFAALRPAPVRTPGHEAGP